MWCNRFLGQTINPLASSQVENQELQKIIDDCIEGSRKAQYRFYNFFSGRMMGVCLRYAKNQAEAEDILQDGFVKVFGNLHKYQPFGSFEGWVRRIFVNTAIEYYRQRRKFIINDIEIENEDFEFSDNVIDKMSADEIMGLIKEMPDGYRMVFNMYAIEGYSHKEIAENLGISIGTSKSQYSRSRTYLQKMMAAKDQVAVDYRAQDYE